jgi:hypothetical protein
MTFQGRHHAPCVNVPNPSGLGCKGFAGEGDDALPIRADGDHHKCVFKPLRRRDFAPCLNLPDAGGSIEFKVSSVPSLVKGDDTLAIRTKGRLDNLIIVAFQGHDFSSRRRVPDARGPVIRGGDRALAVQAEGGDSTLSAYPLKVAISRPVSGFQTRTMLSLSVVVMTRGASPLNAAENGLAPRTIKSAAL